MIAGDLSGNELNNALRCEKETQCHEFKRKNKIAVATFCEFYYERDALGAAWFRNKYNLLLVK